MMPAISEAMDRKPSTPPEGTNTSTITSSTPASNSRTDQARGSMAGKRNQVDFMPKAAILSLVDFCQNGYQREGSGVVAGAADDNPVSLDRHDDDTRTAAD